MVGAVPQQDSLVTQAVSGICPGLVRARTDQPAPAEAPRKWPVVPDDAEPCDDYLLSAKTLNVQAELPREIAMLHVYQVQHEKAYRLWLNGSGIKPLRTPPLSLPQLALNRHIRSDGPPSADTLREIWDLSGGYFRPSLVELGRRLGQLHHNIGSSLCLVIADHTELGIPWEFMKLSSTERIGATIATTRWQPIVSDEGGLVLMPEAEPTGREILSYVCRELTKANSERSFFRRHFSGTRVFTDIRRFRGAMVAVGAEVGLVYLACHGTFFGQEGIGLKELALGSSKEEEQQLGYLELDRLSLQLLRHSRALVFINACDSGWHRREREYFQDDYLRGFPELFLAKGARGVIGTLAAVADEPATAIAQALLRDARSHPDQPLAELLRRARAGAQQAYEQEGSDRNLERLIYTFSYVYYGNPMLQLNLAPEAIEGAQDG